MYCRPMPYSVLLALPDERKLKSCSPALQKRLAKRVKSLQADSRPQGVKKLLAESNLYRTREGDYCAIYTIRDNELIVSSRSETARTCTDNTACPGAQ
jgi:mRNA-degrading endonuclease RelE of RelBE toxin-antitoxin system